MRWPDPRELYWQTELEAHRLLAGQVNLILDAKHDTVHIAKRKGRRSLLRFIDTWYRGARRIADFSKLEDIPPVRGDTFLMLQPDRLVAMRRAYKRCQKLLHWRQP